MQSDNINIDTRYHDGSALIVLLLVIFVTLITFLCLWHQIGDGKRARVVSAELDRVESLTNTKE